MSTADVQARVQAIIDRRVASGDEVGIQVAVVEHGRVVVDAVCGTADPDRGRAVAPGTLFFAASTAKGVASAVAHVLVERGKLAYDMRAVDVWPEFGAHGKDQVTLRHVLLHTAGVPAPPYDTTVEELCDWEHMCAVLADARPWWEPGTRFGYHAKTFGFLLGEIVRRATGRTLSWWLREAVTFPLGIGDEVHFGVPGELLDRVARQQPPIGPATPAPAGRASMAAVQFEGRDEVMGVPSAWAFGFSPGRPGGVPSRPGSTFGMVGMNGSAAYADIDSGVTVAVMRSRFDPQLAAVTEIDRVGADATSGERSNRA